MRVRKRDQTLEDVSFDKVVRRIKHFCDDLVVIDPHAIAQKICSRIYDEVDTCKLDELASEISSSLATVHPDYSTLAARIIISNHQKNTLASFSAGATVSTLAQVAAARSAVVQRRLPRRDTRTAPRAMQCAFLVSRA